MWETNTCDASAAVTEATGRIWSKTWSFRGQGVDLDGPPGLMNVSGNGGASTSHEDHHRAPAHKQLPRVLERRLGAG
jgi:hypothetical protein